MYGNEKRVQGSAQVGDKVCYYDVSNQNCPVYEVQASPYDEYNEALFGKDNKDYMLYNKEAGFKWSDLRQNWFFVNKVNA